MDLTYGTFHSPEEAKNELHRVIRSSKKVIEHQLKKTSTGEVTGDRAVVLYGDPHSDKEYVVIVWTKGSDYYCMGTSAPLARALQFEERWNTGLGLDDPAAKSK